MLKSWGWGGWVAHVIMESAQGPNPSFFLFIRLLFDLGACWDQDLDQGLTIALRLDYRTLHFKQKLLKFK